MIRNSKSDRIEKKLKNFMSDYIQSATLEICRSTEISKSESYDHYQHISEKYRRDTLERLVPFLMKGLDLGLFDNNLFFNEESIMDEVMYNETLVKIGEIDRSVIRYSVLNLPQMDNRLLTNILNFSPSSHPPILNPEDGRWCSIKTSEFLVLTVKSRIDDLKAILTWYQSEGADSPGPEPSKHFPSVIETAETKPGHFCTIFTHEGERPLNQNEYRELLSSKSSFEMFIDGIEKQAWTANKGTFTGPKKFNLNELTLIADYIITRKFRRPATILKYSPESRANAKQIFKQARKKVDVPLGRKEWRAFKMVESRKCDANLYGFCPPIGFKYCLIMPQVDNSQ